MQWAHLVSSLNLYLVKDVNEVPDFGGVASCLAEFMAELSYECARDSYDKDLNVLPERATVLRGEMVKLDSEVEKVFYNRHGQETSRREGAVKGAL